MYFILDYVHDSEDELIANLPVILSKFSKTVVEEKIDFPDGFVFEIKAKPITTNGKFYSEFSLSDNREWLSREHSDTYNSLRKEGKYEEANEFRKKYSVLITNKGE